MRFYINKAAWNDFSTSPLDLDFLKIIDKKLYIVNKFLVKSSFVYLYYSFLCVDLFFNYIKWTNELCTNIKKSTFQCGENITKNYIKNKKNTANLVLRNLSMKLFLSFHHSYLSNYQASPLQECILLFILVYSL